MASQGQTPTTPIEKPGKGWDSGIRRRCEKETEWRASRKSFGVDPPGRDGNRDADNQESESRGVDPPGRVANLTLDDDSVGNRTNLSSDEISSSEYSSGGEDGSYYHGFLI